MPVKVPNDLPAKYVLKREGIFVMDESRALSQDIRPLKIIILNLMPTKIETEIQLLRLIGNNPLQAEIVLLHPETYQAKNTPAEYLSRFYKTFSAIKNERFDGMIITGAPVEQMEFEEVAYWDELTQIMEWSKKNVTSVLHICWGLRPGSTTTTGSRSISFRQSNSVSSAIMRCVPTFRCFAVLTIAFSCPIPGTRKSGGRISRKSRTWRFLPNRRKWVCALWPTSTEAKFSSPAMPNTIPIRCRTSISGMRARGCRSRFPRTITHRMIPIGCRWCCGAAMPIFVFQLA